MNDYGEPWEVKYWYPDQPFLACMVRKQGHTLTNVADRVPSGVAERIVACVNALAGMNPDAVNDVVRALETLVEFETETCNGIDEYGGDSGLIAQDFEKARKALADLKGAKDDQGR